MWSSNAAIASRRVLRNSGVVASMTVAVISPSSWTVTAKEALLRPVLFNFRVFWLVGKAEGGNILGSLWQRVA